MGLPHGLVVKNPPASAGELRHRFHPGVRETPWRWACNSLQHFCLENPIDRGAWWAAVLGVTKSQTQLKQLSMPTQKAINGIVRSPGKVKEYSRQT